MTVNQQHVVKDKNAAVVGNPLEPSDGQQSRNPYIAGDVVKSQFGFFGRTVVFEEVRRSLQQQNNRAIVLQGQRRTGKTSILRQLELRLNDEGGYLPVYFDLLHVKREPLGRLLFQLARGIASQMKLAEPERQHFDNRGEFFRKEFMHAALTAASGSRIVLLLDEFDALDNPNEHCAGGAFVGYLRDWLPEADRVHCVFVVARSLEEMSVEAAKMLQQFRTSYVERFDRDTITELVRQSERSGGLIWAKDAVQRIWDWTHGHPYFSQLLCSVVWESASSGDSSVQKATSAIVDDAVPTALQQGENAFKWIWGGLSRAEKLILSAIAATGQESISKVDLENIVRQFGELLVREAQATRELLIERDLLEYVDSGKSESRLRPVVPLFQKWIADNRPLEKVRSESRPVDGLADHLYSVGQIHHRSGIPEKAELCLLEALSANENHLKARLLLGQIQLDTNRASDAVNTFELAWQCDREEAAADLVRALLASDQNKAEDDRQEIYGRILAVDPNHTLAQTRLDEIHEARRQRKIADLHHKARRAQSDWDWPRAILIYEELSSFDPQNGDWLRLLSVVQTEYAEHRITIALAHQHREEWAKATQMFEQLIQEHGDIGGLSKRLAAVQHARKTAENYDRAVSMLDEAKMTEAAQILTEIVGAQPDYKNAIEELLLAVKGVSVASIEQEMTRQRIELLSCMATNAENLPQMPLFRRMPLTQAQREKSSDRTKRQLVADSDQGVYIFRLLKDDQFNLPEEQENACEYVLAHQERIAECGACHFHSDSNVSSFEGRRFSARVQVGEEHIRPRINLQELSDPGEQLQTLNRCSGITESLIISVAADSVDEVIPNETPDTDSRNPSQRGLFSRLFSWISV